MRHNWLVRHVLKSLAWKKTRQLLGQLHYLFSYWWFRLVFQAREQTAVRSYPSRRLCLPDILARLAYSARGFLAWSCRQFIISLLNIILFSRCLNRYRRRFLNHSPHWFRLLWLLLFSALFVLVSLIQALARWMISYIRCLRHRCHIYPRVRWLLLSSLSCVHSCGSSVCMAAWSLCHSYPCFIQQQA